MNVLLAALTLIPHLHVDRLPAYIPEEPDETTTVIYSSFMRKHNGQLYLCGTAKKYGRNDIARFVFSLEKDWRIYEPLQDSGEIWESWDQTYLEICEGDGE